MTEHLLDTNVLSELRKGKRADRGVTRWFDAHDGSRLWTSVIVVGEIRRGVERLRRRDHQAADGLDDWLTELIERFESRILPVTAEVADRWGRMGVPDPVPVADGLIAATALVHDLVVVSRNRRDVEAAGAPVIDPFSG